jgi:CheY-like chemotaxis protein
VILVVDDEEPVRSLLAMVLEDCGYQVCTAVHGAHALELIAQEPPDLVISDVMMPILGGVELCRKVKQEDPVPVILMSAAGPSIAAGAGADAFIAKPFDLDQMERVVARCLEQPA